MIDLKPIVDGNAKYAYGYKDCENPFPKPAQNLAIVTCMDAWIHVHEATDFEIKLGDAHIIRNAGASAQEALRSLIVSQQILGTNQVWVVKHTRCGMAGVTNKTISEIVEKNVGVCAHHIDFMPFGELAQAVKDDVRWLRRNQYMSTLNPDDITGWIFHLETGRLEQITVD